MSQDFRVSFAYRLLALHTHIHKPFFKLTKTRFKGFFLSVGRLLVRWDFFFRSLLETPRRAEKHVQAL
jgi:hypothetical protein